MPRHTVKRLRQKYGRFFILHFLRSGLATAAALAHAAATHYKSSTSFIHALIYPAKDSPIPCKWRCHTMGKACPYPANGAAIPGKWQRRAPDVAFRTAFSSCLTTIFLHQEVMAAAG